MQTMMNAAVGEAVRGGAVWGGTGAIAGGFSGGAGGALVGGFCGFVAGAYSSWHAFWYQRPDTSQTHH
jgi:L-aminopeptidase/D-esterase-like protein